MALESVTPFCEQDYLSAIAPFATWIVPHVEKVHGWRVRLGTSSPVLLIHRLAISQVHEKPHNSAESSPWTKFATCRMGAV